ncbi:unnamed protein product [Lampetra planeri]
MPANAEIETGGVETRRQARGERGRRRGERINDSETRRDAEGRGDTGTHAPGSDMLRKGRSWEQPSQQQQQQQPHQQQQPQPTALRGGIVVP